MTHKQPTGSPCFLFDGFSAAEQEAFWQEMPPPLAFEKGASIYSTDCFRPALGILCQGEARVIQIDAEGHQVIMNVLQEGDILGAAALFDEPEAYVSNIVALRLCEVRFLSQSLLESWMQRDFRIARNYIRFLSGRIRFLNRRIAGFTGGTSEDRLLLYLQQHQRADGQVDLPRHMTDLARALDIGRSSLYRSLDALEAAGVIKREQKKIWLV